MPRYIIDEYTTDKNPNYSFDPAGPQMDHTHGIHTLQFNSTPDFTEIKECKIPADIILKSQSDTLIRFYLDSGAASSVSGEKNFRHFLERNNFVIFWNQPLSSSPPLNAEPGSASARHSKIQSTAIVSAFPFLRFIYRSARLHNPTRSVFSFRP